MTTQFISAQGIGLIGVLCFILSFQIKSNRALYLTQGIGSAAFCVQFLLVGAYTGCLNLVLLVIRNITLIKINDWKWLQWKGWVVVLSIICFGIMILTWDGPVSILPFIAMTGSNIGMWTNNAQKIRLANLVCISPAWLIYDTIVGAYAGTLNECVVLGSIIVSIIRYGWKAMGDPNADFQKK